jgi:hypothetical protein
MPDLDRVERSFSPLWRAPYRLLAGGHPPEIIAEELSKRAAAELRKQGGIQGFEPFLQICLAPEQRSEPKTTLADVSRSIEQRFGQARDVKLLSRATQQARAKIIAGWALPGPNQLAEEFLRALIHHHFFAKIPVVSVGEKRRFNDVAEARVFEGQVWQNLEPQIEKLARRVIADPTASKLRAPKSMRPHLSTAELLDTPI